jgi:hypothetical protein
MLIAVAGPYSATTEEKMQSNLDAMNDACAEVYKKGHIPVVGVNNALPVLQRLSPEKRTGAIMKISLAIVDRCDAILMIGESPGTNQERALVMKKGLPVYNSIDEIPKNIIQ